MPQKVTAVSAQVDRGVRPHALPRKKPAVFHHPTMGMPLYDGLAMDLHAMTYAEPLFAEVDRLRAVLAASCDEERSQLWEAGPGGGCSRAITAEADVRRLRAALEVAVRQNEHDMLMTGDELRACLAALGA